jgi:mitochondrial enoyl-[acyl-carrier protein] reductase / trans-2-enoyl-CoA reductase
MKAVQFSVFGPPDQVAELIELPDPGEPGAGEVVIDIEACPINPASLLLLEGRYGVRPNLPAPVHSEGVGKVAKIGTGVTHLKLGDRVLLPRDGTWCQRIKAPAKGLFALPAGVDPLQLAMTRVNPPTAYLMLRDYVKLAAGDWVIQDAANSGVGHALIAIGRELGYRTVNIVRRADLIAPLKTTGADVVVVDGPNLAAEVAAATGNGAIRLGIDAIGGEACLRLSSCMAEGGTVLNYGLLSGKPCMIGAEQLVFRDVTLKGFWLAKWFQTATPADIQEVYGKLIAMIAAGKIKVAVAATYPLTEIKQALRHAAQESRSGKVLLTPNA